MRKNFIISVFCLGILAFGAAQAARAADFIVTTSQDRNGTCISNGDCSLREAVKAANAIGGQNNIYFPQFLDGQIFDLTLGELGIHNGTLNIQGAGRYFVHIRGNGSRIFSVVNGARLELRGLKLTNGNGTGALSSGKGGAIYVESNRNCRLLLDGVMVSGNSASIGGGINAEVATTTITNSIISGNTATSFGGGLMVSALTIENSSIVNNRSVNSIGGGAYISGGVSTLRNVTVSDNRANNVGGIYYQAFTVSDSLRMEYITVAHNASDDSGSGGFGCNGTTGLSGTLSIFYGNTNRFGSLTNPNVEGFCTLGGANQIGPNTPNPNFGPLTFDGVQPHYRPLLAGSGAIDSGLTSGFPATDVRGAGRATDGNGDGQFISDLGSYEAPSKVTNTIDEIITPGSLSLRRAIESAPENSEIIFDSVLFSTPQTIQSPGFNYVINKNLTVRGPGSGLLTLGRTDIWSVFYIAPGKTLELYGVKLTGGGNPNGGTGGSIINQGTLNGVDINVSGGNASIGGGIYNNGTLYLSYSTIAGNTAPNAGAGIFNASQKSVYVFHSTVSGNTATQAGGGIYNEGWLYVYNSTVSGNRAINGKAGGIYNATSTGIANVANSTIVNNRADGFAGAGVWNENFAAGSNTFRARNSIIAANLSGNGNPVDFVGDLTNLGNNIVNNDNPGLMPLGFYGGATQTHAPLSNSPAVNAGNNCILTANGCGDGNFALPNDQRGGIAPRKIGANVDIGAFENSINFNQTSLPNGERTVFYSQTLSVARATSFAEFLSDKPFDFFDSENILAPFTFAVVTVSGQSLPPGLSLSSAGVLSGTPTAAGTYTFTVKATDADGAAGFHRFTLTIAQFNNPPTVSGATLARQAGSPVSNSQIATVGDVENGANGVSVSVTSANPANGVTVSNVVNANGNVTANVIAACSATNAAFTVRASDGSKTTDGTLTVNVSANTAPTLTYPASQTILAGNSINISPTTAQDNGSISSFAIQSVSPALATAPTVNASGVVSVTNANPGGTYTITVRATDNCGATRDATFTLNVTIPTKTVTKIADTDDGVCNTDCSLREAIAAADSGDTIEFASPLFDTPQTITVNPAFGNLYIPDKNLTVNGRGAGLTVISGDNQIRVLNIYNSIVSLNGLTVTNGRDPIAVGGGGIYNNGRLTINNCIISGNTTVGGSGGGINNRFILTVNNSTISGNSATSAVEGGGGIYTHSLTQLVLNNSTISGNSATWGGGGGLYMNQANLKANNSTITANTAASAGGIWDYITDKYIQNSIIAGNSAPSFPDLRTLGTPFFMNNSNLIGGDARLAPLGFYGGATPTHALLSNSPAINAGNNCVLTANACASFNPALPNDQRGANAPRKIGAQVDIGAVERSVTINETTLPNGSQTQAYSQTLTATRATSLAENLSIGEKSELFDSESMLAPFAFSIVPAAGQSLPPGLTLASNGTLSGTPTQPGTYTFTVKAADADTIAGVQVFSITIEGFNNPPTITGAALARQAGSPVSGSTIANVDDVETGAGGVSVSISSANPSNGVTVSNIVNTNGTVTANVLAVCSAANATFTLAAADGNSVTNATLTVNVSSNTAPTLAYPASQTVAANGSATVAPTATGDNGTVTYSIFSVSPALVPAPTINAATGVVSVTNAQPVGAHVITVRATDNCGAITEQSFTLNVTPPPLVVTNTNNGNDGVCDADCSLSEAISAAAPGATIEFSSLFDTPQTISLGIAVSINKPLTINGKGAHLLTIDGNQSTRGFNVNIGAASTVNINNLTVTRGATFNGSGGGIFLAGGGTLNLSDVVVDNCGAVNSGGGIFSSGSNLNIVNSRITANRTLGGGARGAGISIYGGNLSIRGSIVSGNNNLIFQPGLQSFGGGLELESGVTVSIENSTVSDNRSDIGGGIWNNSAILRMSNVTLSGNPNSLAGSGLANASTAVLRNSTVSANTAVSQGFNGGRAGGIYNSGNLTLANVIVADNVAPSAADIENNGSVTLLGANIVETGLSGSVSGAGTVSSADPKLAPLGNYGGATPTQALNAGSPAINAGNNAEALDATGAGLAFDQRGAGALRILGEIVDLGAFEQNVSFNQTSIENGSVGIGYSVQLSATRLTNLPPFTEGSEIVAPTAFEIVPVAGEQLPPGLDLSPTGLLSGTPTMAGAYAFTVKATDTDGIAGTSRYALNILAPTAAAVEVSGSVVTTNGSGIRNVVVTLTDSSGNTRTALTTSFGNFRFEGVAAGEIYVIGVVSKKYTFDQPTQILSVSEDVTGLLFTAQE